jgi:glycosyltransferase involved in cell wall biosynthesis
LDKNWHLKKIIVAVTNDLSTDQRVAKSCKTIYEAGFEPILIGRKLKLSLPIKRAYKVKRYNLWFNSGALFYANYNIRLFVSLIFTNCHAIWANDLDTLLACYLASKLKRVPLIFDSHEYFTEVPEIQHKPLVKKVWLTIEEWIVPKLKFCITVNQSIAGLFKTKYGADFSVVKNIPIQIELQKRSFDLSQLGFVKENLTLILQGSGINVDRGAEELLEAINIVDGINLIVVGAGDVLTFLQTYVLDHKLADRVKFFPRMEYQEMMNYTQLADIGVTLDKNTNINYQYSLPNKLFDYIHAEIPVLASPLVEVGKVIIENDLGWVLSEHSVAAIVSFLKEIKNDKNQLLSKKQNCSLAKVNYSWQKEAEGIKQILKQID